MRIHEIRTIPGPNLHRRPVLWMDLDLEDLTDRESYEVAGFIERLLATLPGVREHGCAERRAGCFVERLRNGTYFGHIVEHVALELSDPAGISVYYGRTRPLGPPGRYGIVVAYRAEHGMRFLLETAVDLVQALADGRELDLESRLEEARRIVRCTELGPSSRALVEAAERRGIPWQRLDCDSLVQLGHGVHLRYIEAALSSRTSAVAIDIAADKELTKIVLRRASIPVPEGRVVSDEEEAVAALRELGCPIVVKPLDGCQGKGVSVDIDTPDATRRAFRLAREFGGRVLVEESVAGRNFRVLIVGDAMVAASERLPAHVIGDGESSIAQLIERANGDPLRGEDHEKPLTRIHVDENLRARLATQGFGLDAVPASGCTVLLRRKASLSTGGTAIDVTERVHPEVARECVRAARVVGLDICGVDLVASDIDRPLRDSGGAIIELNATPGLRMHHFPSAGKARDAAGAILSMLYPGGATGRIPIVSITGTNGKTTTTRMIAHILARSGKKVGMTTTDGIFLGGERIVEGDTTGPLSARTLLSDPAVEIAVLETARGGIVRHGLGYDWSDVGVVTNIGSDHIGQDGIWDLDDLARIKALVAERVREGGTLVLNAEDERVARFAELPQVREHPKRIVYFAMRPQNTIVTRHRARGGTVYVLQDGWIVEATAGREHPLVRPAGIPATLGGMAEFQVANALAAVAACRALGATRADIIAALMTFRADAENPGRSNLYRLGAGHVLMDYGHNARALEAVCEMAARWRGRRLTAVLGMPGDRADWVSQQAAQRAATGFQRIIVREDDDLRGRAPGDMAALLERAIRDTSPDCECIVVRDSAAALETAVRSMQDGEIVVAFYEHLEPMLAVLERYHAVPVSAIPARDPSRSDGRQSQLPSRPISIRQNLATGEI